MLKKIGLKSSGSVFQNIKDIGFLENDEYKALKLLTLLPNRVTFS